MKKAVKIVILGITSLIICYYGYFLFISFVCSHSMDFHTYKKYTWLLKDSIRSDIDTSVSYSYTKKRDVVNGICFKKHNFFIIIWEFKDLKNVDIKKIRIDTNINLYDLKFFSGEILNKNASPEINIKFGFNFKNSFNVNLDESSELIKRFETNNYGGFYGRIYRLSFSNEKNKHVVLYNNKEVVPALFVMYKARGSFFVIMINSDKQLDESIINILNLK